MANYINGELSDEPIARITGDGEFDRPESVFRRFPLNEDIEPNRFHLYVSYACPWAHRTIIVRNLKKLDKVIGMSVTNAYMDENGWAFSTGCDPHYLADVYVQADNYYTGKISVPVLWDKKKKTIVNNESSEIVRILNLSFDEFTDSSIDLYPEHIREVIDEINDKIYNNVNNGVYKTGFARTQVAYERSFDRLFATLDELDDMLGKERFLTGNYLTEADVRLFTTLIRFDPVYFGHFKCNKKRIYDYKSLWSYMKCIYQMPEVKPTVNFEHIKEHYYRSHKWINPTQIVPKGPDMDLDSPHDRGEVRFWLKHH